VKRFTLLVCLTAAAPAVSAAELVIRDIGVGLELPPTGFTYTRHDDAGSTSGDDSFSSGFGVEVHGRWSFARTGDSQGLVAGVALAGDRASYANGGTWATSEVRGLAGWGWAASDRVTLIAEGLLGLGIGRLSIDGNGAFSGYSATGGVISTGIEAAALWSVTDRMVLSGVVGYRISKAKPSGDGVDLDLSLSGFVLALGAEWRITDRPFLLE
jgi:hypothetical protein